MSRLISILVLAFLQFFGWAPLHDLQRWRLRNSKRTIILFPHTTYADFYIMILYILAYPEELKTLRTLVKPQPFKYAGWLLRRFGAIPATRVDEQNGGGVERIVSELAGDDFALMISPKGTIVNRPWRSGYYHLAKALNADIRIAGLDYERRAAYIGHTIKVDLPIDEMNEKLKIEMGRIVPLFPAEEGIPIRRHDPAKIGIFANPFWPIVDVFKPFMLVMVYVTAVSIYNDLY